ncbi:MAG: DUF2188 domain-containing protein [Leptolyngbya sp.]|nr:DUF2188 domain-containing protein [Candidatus Melainabacteria bacterium]
MKKTETTIHVVPINGQWAVMTDERDCIKEGLETREAAIKIAGQAAADGTFAFMMIHNKDDLKRKSAA